MVRIHFEDDGQDILWWDIDEHGVVQACNMQEWVWKGTQVQMTVSGNEPSKVQPGDRLVCEFKDGRIGIFQHPVEKIELVD
ncbi:MAG: hypothetical protein Q8O55_01660 [Dehalococcoidales bacterium]|nr:hypothetical protein [Dehalococcoidales bacterium]